MICTNCDKEVPDTTKVCGYCRYRLGCRLTIKPGDILINKYRTEERIGQGALGVL